MTIPPLSFSQKLQAKLLAMASGGDPLSRSVKLVIPAVLGIFFLAMYLYQPSFLSLHAPKIHEPNVPQKIQFDFKAFSTNGADDVRAAKVVEAMKKTFWGYREKAWGADEIRPISGDKRNPRNAWGATLIDSMTTIAVMGLQEEFWLELNHTIQAVDFSKAYGLVDPFETTIRYLGAMVSTVELMEAGVIDAGNDTEKQALLKQAVHLATKLAPAFDTPTGLVWPRVNFTTDLGAKDWKTVGTPKTPVIGLARAGSNWLEYRTLSKQTGDPIYLKNATRAWSQLVWNQYYEEFPGLPDGPRDIMTGVPTGKIRTWGGGADSYYEYLIKAHILDPKGKHSAKYRDRWIEAVESTKKYLASWSEMPTEGNGSRHLFLASWVNGWLVNEMGHLTCFAPGNFLLGGKYLGREDIVQFGLDTLEACHHTYAATETHIGPEQFCWTPMNNTGTADDKEKEDKEKKAEAKKSAETVSGQLVEQPAMPTFNKRTSWRPISPKQKQDLAHKGYWVASAGYMLRPETIESYFYAYRITGDKKYQDWAWDAFQGIMKYASAPYGFAELKNVNVADPELKQGNQRDKSESFWSAEVLKYLYLIFSDADKINLDEWVFSTEAHPFRRIKHSAKENDP